VVFDYPKANYGGRVVVPQNTGNAVPRSGRMRDFRETRSPANLVILRIGERSSASLGGGAKDCKQSFFDALENERIAAGNCESKSSSRENVLLDGVLEKEE
jgi:hypothetical protein